MDYHAAMDDMSRDLPYRGVLERSIEHIENGLRRPLTLEEIARHSWLSKYHLHRVFRALTGLRLMDYVRQRKLSASLDELLKGQRPVQDIARDFGFDYPQSYIRAFSRCFGMSPQRLRDSGTAVAITDRLDLSRLTEIGANGLLDRPRLVVKPAFTVTGCRHKIDLARNLEEFTVTRLANEFWYHRMKEVPDVVDPHVYRGIILHSGDPAYNWYLTATETAGTSPLPEGMERLPIDTHTYASFTYVSKLHPRYLTMADVSELYARVFGDWLPNSAYRMAAGFHIEAVDMHAVREDYGEFTLMVPVIRS